jgi:hypothetical protein
MVAAESSASEGDTVSGASTGWSGVAAIALDSLKRRPAGHA